MYRYAIPALALLALLLVGAGPAVADGGDAGVCLVGADTACTDSPHSETATPTDDAANESDGTSTGASNSSGPDAGVCVVGAGGPCNADRPAKETGARSGTSGESTETDADADAGVCVVGAGGPCNADGGAGDAREGGAAIGAGDAAESTQVWALEDRDRTTPVGAGLVGSLWDAIEAVTVHYRALLAALA